MRHEHEVPGLVPVVVDGVVVDVAEDGLSPQPVGVVVRVDVLAQLVDHVHRGLGLGIELALEMKKEPSPLI